MCLRVHLCREVGGRQLHCSQDIDDSKEFPSDMVAVIHGDDKTFHQFLSRSHVEKCLRAMGARVTSRKTKLSTHYVIGCRFKAGVSARVYMCTHACCQPVCVCNVKVCTQEVAARPNFPLRFN